MLDVLLVSVAAQKLLDLHKTLSYKKSNFQECSPCCDCKQEKFANTRHFDFLDFLNLRFMCLWTNASRWFVFCTVSIGLTAKWDYVLESDPKPLNLMNKLPSV